MKEFKYVIKDEQGIHARPAGILVKAIAKKTSDIKIKKAGAEKGKVARIALNWPQAVLRLEYVEDGQENVTMEEANEGEQE